jgi:hypothetical protein
VSPAIAHKMNGMRIATMISGESVISPEYPPSSA